MGFKRQFEGIFYKAMGILFIALLCFLPIKAQKQANIWLFKDSLKLDFNSDAAQIIRNFPSALFSVNNIASICDKDGLLIAYTNNQQVYNREHRIMKNGDNLKLSTYSFHTAMFVPQPGSHGRFLYLFTSGSADDGYDLPVRGRPFPFYPFHFSVIDMEGDNGLGEVILKNQYLFENPACTMTATLHANGHDVWVAAYDFVKHDIYLYLLTAKGISLRKQFDLPDWSPYVSAIVTSANANYQLRFSPIGNGLVVGSAAGRAFCYVAFDHLRGEFAREQIIETGKYGVGALGMDFSANGKFLYLATGWADPYPNSALLQQEITMPLAWDPIVIHSLQGQYLSRSLQRGSDNKIYMTPINGGYMNIPVINQPDLKGGGCDYQEAQVVSTLPLNPGLLIPIMPPIFNCKLDLGPDTTICVGEKKSIKVEGYPQNFRWSDGSTGNELLIEQPGTYWVSQQTEYCNYRDSIVVREKAAPKLALDAVYEICPGSELEIDPGVADTYNWSNGSTTRILKTGESGIYSVKGSNECGVSEVKTEVALKSIEFPNVFTPNGDGLNEEFSLLKGDYLSGGKLDVYNRWGKKVYSANNYNGDWKGENEEAGVYYYHYGSTDCISVKGWVQIIK